MKFKVGDIVLADASEEGSGLVLCEVKGYNKDLMVELEPVNAELVGFARCWMKDEAC